MLLVSPYGFSGCITVFADFFYLDNICLGSDFNMAVFTSSRKSEFKPKYVALGSK